MSTKTGIEWTDSTWNPVTGCTEVSDGCDNCYARILAFRLLKDQYLKAPLAKENEEDLANPFAVRLWQERLQEPLRWKDSRHVFVNSMGDLFHVNVPDLFVQRVFETMLSATQHVFQVLTKRPARMAKFVRKHSGMFSDGIVPAHIWMGTSVESQSVLYRVPQLVSVPASIRFLSCEPLLGPLNLDLNGVHWVIAGGESGPVHRPLDLDWVREIRDECVKSKVPFFFKQVGGRTPKANGKILDGKIWDERPITA